MVNFFFTCVLQTLFVTTSHLPLLRDKWVSSTLDILARYSNFSSTLSVVTVLVTPQLGIIDIDTMKLFWKIICRLYISALVISSNPSGMKVKLLLWSSEYIVRSFLSRDESLELHRISKDVVEIRFDSFPLPIVLWWMSKTRMMDVKN